MKTGTELKFRNPLKMRYVGIDKDYKMNLTAVGKKHFYEMWIVEFEIKPEDKVVKTCWRSFPKDWFGEKG